MVAVVRVMGATVVVPATVARLVTPVIAWFAEVACTAVVPMYAPVKDGAPAAPPDTVSVRKYVPLVVPALATLVGVPDAPPAIMSPSALIGLVIPDEAAHDGPDAPWVSTYPVVPAANRLLVLAAVCTTS